MEQELWYRMRERERSVESVPRCEPEAPREAAKPHRIEQSRRLVGRAVVRVGELIAAERYLPQTR